MLESSFSIFFSNRRTSSFPRTTFFNFCHSFSFSFSTRFPRYCCLFISFQGFSLTVLVVVLVVVDEPAPPVVVVFSVLLVVVEPVSSFLFLIVVSVIFSALAVADFSGFDDSVLVVVVTVLFL